VTLAIRGYPGYGETVRLTTFGSAMGPRWAERTTTVARSGQDLMQARAVWVVVGRADGRPAPLDAAFHRRYGPQPRGAPCRRACPIRGQMEGLATGRGG
jgi:acyl-ACP thioesterase